MFTISGTRWIALVVVCTGAVMMALNGALTVALPTIKRDLVLSDDSLVWVVNSYTLAFGGFLLLSGRVGDMFGHRRTFLFGVSVIMLASLGCGLASSAPALICARALQGSGSAIVAASALPLLGALYTDNAKRTRALGIYGFVSISGGCVGMLLSGMITSTLNWHWVFFINLPAGILIHIIGKTSLPDTHCAPRTRLDFGGAVTVTGSLILALYAVTCVGTDNLAPHLRAVSTLGAIALFLLFLAIEACVKAPLLPLGLFRNRNVSVINIVGSLWAIALSAWIFISTLYLQFVLQHPALQVSFDYLPADLVAAFISISVCATVVLRCGVKFSLVSGLFVAAVGILLFARAPIAASGLFDVLPGMLLVGLGGGMVSSPLLIAALESVPPQDVGLASGLIRTVSLMSGALGLGAVTRIASATTQKLLEYGADSSNALNDGYHVAFFASALSAASAALVAAVLLRIEKKRPIIAM